LGEIEMVNEFPIKPIKRILKRYYQGEISIDTCIYVRDVLLNFTEYLAFEGVKEFGEYNQRRKMQGLPVLKRLDRSTFVNIGSKIFNLLMDINIGEVGECNGLLLCQDDIMQRKEQKDIIKDAGVEVV